MKKIRPKIKISPTISSGKVATFSLMFRFFIANVEDAKNKAGSLLKTDLRCQNGTGRSRVSVYELWLWHVVGLTKVQTFPTIPSAFSSNKHELSIVIPLGKN